MELDSMAGTLVRWQDRARSLWFPFSAPYPGADDGRRLFVRGEGVWLEDVEGRRYLDGVGALEAMAIGHGRAELADVAVEQMRSLAFLDVFRHTSLPAIELAAKLSALAPMSEAVVQFTPGGSEAVEVALKLALQYHYLRGEPGRQFVISRNGAYHGVTFGAMNCDGGYYSTRNDIFLRHGGFGIVAEGPATGPGWGLGARHAAGAPEFARAIEKVGAGSIAAIIVDPIGTASGVAAAPVEDLQEIRRLCDRYGILLIVDEVITGFCRTGRMFASELSGVSPDLMTVSKALSSGYMPIGACLAAETVTDVFRGAPQADGLFAHGHTYGGHPVACAVALANIAILEREGLAQRAGPIGDYLVRGLNGLRHHQSVVDARGVGALVGLEVVGDDAAAGSFGTARAAAQWLRRRCRDLGLITLTVHPGTVLLFAPPLIIQEREVDELVRILDAALTDLDKAIATPGGVA